MIEFVKSLVLSIFLAVVLIVFSLGLGSVLASEVDGFKLDEVSINYKRFIGETRHPLFLHSKQKEEVNLNLNTTVLNVFYFNNTVHSQTDSSQYKVVGWNLFLGARVFRSLDLQVEHFSKHLLDESYSVMRFPVENSIGFKWYLYRNDKQKESIF